MPSFRRKELIQAKRVCWRLKEAREAAHVSMAELAKRTRISERHLRAIEECRFDDIPFATIYKKNFVRRYAETLGMDAHTYIAQFENEEHTADPPLQHPHRTIQFPWLTHLPLFLRITSIGLFAVLLVGYLGWQVYQIVKPPTLMIYTPDNGLVTETPSITVRGHTEPGSAVKVNGQPITRDERGQFDATIPLASGINPITISATKKHGKSTSETRYVIVRELQRFSRR